MTYCLRVVVYCLVMLVPFQVTAQTPVGDVPTSARAEDGDYISWREHIIDEPSTAGIDLSGSDGLVMADIDDDGYEDIVSVHESDSEYDSSAVDPNFDVGTDGYVRIAFGSADPNVWTNVTLAEGADASAAEDAAIADVNGDGHLDVVVAAELAHLIYLQNPGAGVRTKPWPRLILPVTKGRGSYIRVFFADFDGDGRPEVSAANKGAQRIGPAEYARSTPVVLYRVNGDPLKGESWSEIELGRYSVPQNAEPVDLDGDGDLDVIVGTRGEERLVFFENTGNLSFREHAIGINRMRVAGFNLEYADLNNDGRLDIIGAGNGRGAGGLVWLEQPVLIDDTWNAHEIGTFSPDSMTGMEMADINGDGYLDVMAGSYSRGPREGDGDVTVHDALGRIGWFQHPGGDGTGNWIRHDISRRKRGMYDKFIARDADGDGDVDFFGTRGNSAPYDGVYWLEQVRSDIPRPAFERARDEDSPEMPLP